MMIVVVVARLNKQRQTAMICLNLCIRLGSKSIENIISLIVILH